METKKTVKQQPNTLSHSILYVVPVIAHTSSNKANRSLNVTHSAVVRGPRPGVTPVLLVTYCILTLTGHVYFMKDRLLSALCAPRVFLNEAVHDLVTHSVIVRCRALALEPKTTNARLVMVRESAWCVRRRCKRLATCDSTFTRTPQNRVGTRLAL